MRGYARSKANTSNRRTIHRGDRVTCEDENGETVTYTLVDGPSDVSRGHLAPATALARALRGAAYGDTIEVALPNGHKRTLTVIAVAPGS